MTYAQIEKRIRFLLTGSSTGSLDYLAADMLANVNEALNRTVSVMMRADSRWEFDDSNFETLPVGTTNLQNSQADYNIASGSFLNLIRLEVKDPSGNWIFLNPISYEDKRGVAMTEWAKTEGMPRDYDKVGTSIILYPTPNYSSEAGLRAYFQRPPSYFTAGDADKEPGFNPLYHDILPVRASIDYCLANGLNNTMVSLENKLARLETDLVDDIAKRSRDEQPRMSVYNEDYGMDNGVAEGSSSIDW